MKASELRIGNLVQLYRKPTDKEKTIHKVKQIGEELIMLEDGFLVNTDSGIEPIPLTEEWLKRFGAEENIFGIIDNMWVQFEDGEWLVCNDNDGVYDIPTIKHVHQLQNIYHALTGEELKIKNK